MTTAAAKAERTTGYHRLESRQGGAGCAMAACAELLDGVTQQFPLAAPTMPQLLALRHEIPTSLGAFTAAPHEYITAFLAKLAATLLHAPTVLQAYATAEEDRARATEAAATSMAVNARILETLDRIANAPARATTYAPARAPTYAPPAAHSRYGQANGRLDTRVYTHLASGRSPDGRELCIKHVKGILKLDSRGCGDPNCGRFHYGNRVALEAALPEALRPLI